MTIKEVEALTGMTRANIRFYEREGLLSPARGENGYRDYSAQEVEALRRVLLLRALGLSLEELRALAAGEEELTPALARRMAALDAQRDELDSAQRVCREICGDGANWETLDAQKYLDSLRSGPASRPEPPEADAVPAVRAPWRRLLARVLDGLLWQTIWLLFLILVCHINPAGTDTPGALADIAASLLLPLALEPAALTLFGATPGKWAAGLRVLDGEDRRLTYSAALRRTWRVLLFGLGLNLPLADLWRLWRSYRACEAGEELPWEEGSSLALPQESHLRAGLLSAATVSALLAALTLAVGAALTPMHRGDLTAAEFCENYNRLTTFLLGSGSDLLDETGSWDLPEQGENGAFYIYLSEPAPDFEIIEEDGAVVRVSFHQEITGGELPISSAAYQNQMYLAALALGGAEPALSPFSAGREELEALLRVQPVQSFHCDAGGLTLACEVVHSGYLETSLSSETIDLMPEGDDCSFSIFFSVTRDGG